MKRILLLAGLLYGKSILLARSFAIAGQVTDSTRQPLERAAVWLQALNDQARQTTLTDSLGWYRFALLSPGSYLVEASHTGYQPQVSDTILLRAESPVAGFDFTLSAVGSQLAGVTITAGRAAVQVEGGKMVFNLQQQAVTAGQTAFDVLRKLPGIGTDQNENILFRGTTGVNLMVDGKMTYLSGAQLVNYLKGLPAEELSKIELVATPDAGQDAAGNAGIIQIITRKRRGQGMAVDLRSAVSRAKYWMTNQNMTASFQNRQWSVFGSLDYNTPHRYYDKRSGNTLPGDSLRLQRTQQTSFKIRYYTWRTGIDWQLHTKHQLRLRYHGYLDDFKGQHLATVYTVQPPAGILKSFIRSSNTLKEPYHYDAPGLSYRFDMDSTGKKITADIDYTSYRNYSDGLLVTRQFYAGGGFAGYNQLQVHQPGAIRIKSVKTDATLPFKTILVTTGLKYAEVRNDNRYQFDSLQNGQLVPAESMSDHFRYKEQIAAAYVSGSGSWKTIQINAGVRIERTDASGYTVKTGAGNLWKYTQLFPSASITQQWGRDHQISLSASRRINRPSYADLNPVRWYSDPYFYYSGNPYLVPERAWVYAALYSFRKKWVLSASYNRSVNQMNRQLVVEGATIKSQTANIGTLQRLDLTVSLPVHPLPFWNIQVFSDMSYTSYPIPVRNGPRQLKQWANSSTIQQSFALPFHWEATLNGHYYSAELRGVYLTRPAWLVDAGIRKSFLQNRLTVQFNCNDVFHTNRYAAFSRTDITDYFYNDRPNSRQVALSVTYHIGGRTVKETNRKIEEQERL